MQKLKGVENFMKSEINNRNISVLIYSCDSYSDIWEPFFTLFFRYWNCPYEVYLTTETLKCPNDRVITLNHEGQWTDRIRAAVKDIPTKYIIGMCEDMFMRKPVRQDVIKSCYDYMETDKKTACFNFEREYEWCLPSEYPEFGQKLYNSIYRKSCQPTLWRKDILEDYLSESLPPWDWELSPTPNKYKHYVFVGDEKDLVFDYGYYHNQWFGVRKGKWVADDVVPLFEREGIDVNYSIRGFFKDNEKK